jgi:hypothetical protein
VKREGKCSTRVYAGTFSGHLCERNSVVVRNGLGYCKQHDPVRIKEENQRKSAERDKAWKRSEAIRSACKKLQDVKDQIIARARELPEMSDLVSRMDGAVDEIASAERGE